MINCLHIFVFSIYVFVKLMYKYIKYMCMLVPVCVCLCWLAFADLLYYDFWLFLQVCAVGSI